MGDGISLLLLFSLFIAGTTLDSDEVLARILQFQEHVLALDGSSAIRAGHSYWLVRKTSKTERKYPKIVTLAMQLGISEDCIQGFLGRKFKSKLDAHLPGFHYRDMAPGVFVSIKKRDKKGMWIEQAAAPELGQNIVKENCRHWRNLRSASKMMRTPESKPPEPEQLPPCPPKLPPDKIVSSPGEEKIVVTEEQVIDLLCKSLNISREQLSELFDFRLKTAAATAATVAPSPLAQRQILEDIIQVHYFIPDDKIIANDYPTLQEKKISLEHDGDIQAVLREISKLAQQVHSKNLLSFPQANDRSTSFVRIPTCTSLASFKMNARRPGNKFAESILLACTPDKMSIRPDQDEENNKDSDEDDDGDQHEQVQSEEDIARFFFLTWGRQYEDSFVVAADKLGLPMMGKKMPAERAAAMWQEANIGVRAQQAIHKHYNNWFGSKFTVPDGEINELAKDTVELISDSVKLEGIEYHYWHKDPAEVISHALEPHIQDESDIDLKRLCTSMDLVFGADHGQGSFRSGIRVIVRGENTGKKIDEARSCGEIECRKDTLEIVQATLGPLLNNYLNEIVHYTSEEQEWDGSVTFFRGGNDKKLYVSFKKEPVKRRTEDVEVLKVPLRMFITGDLAFYAMFLGKDGSSMKWCWLCQLSHMSWQKEGHEPGRLWTLEDLMAEADGRGENKSVKGVKTHPLLDGIPIRRYILPCLHISLGVINRLIKACLDYVNDTLEEIPEDLIRIRDQYFDILIKQKDWKEAAADWDRRNGQTLSSMRLERTQVIKKKKHKSLSQDEIKELENKRQSLSMGIQKLVSEKKETGRVLAELSKDLRKLKKNLTLKEKTSTPVWNRPIRSRIEREALLKNGINRGKAHGRELNGEDCRALAGNRCEAVFSSIIAVVREEAERLGKISIGNKVVAYCESIKGSLVLWDSIISQCSVSSENFDGEQQVESMECTIKKAIASIRALKISLGPKFHSVEDHLIWQLQLYKGFLELREDWVERLHQIGLKDNKRSQRLRDREKKFAAHSKWEELSNHMSVKKVQLEVNNASKRNLTTKRPAGSSKTEVEKKRKRQVQRNQVEEGLVLKKHKSSLAINLQEYKTKKENSSKNQSET